MYSTIQLQVDHQGIAQLTLNRPEVKNAFNATMIGELIHAINELSINQSIRVIVLASSGNQFSAGADINWMKSIAAKTKEENIEDAERLSTLMEVLYQCPIPTLARIQGAVFGGATGLVACCDIAIASASAKFCFSEVRIGLIPAVISPYVINAIGVRNTNKLFLTAETFDADFARTIGLIHEVCKPDQLDSSVQRMIEVLLDNSPQALRKSKQLTHQAGAASLDQATLDYTVNAIADIRASDEGKEGLHAFLEKRKPAWQRH